MKGQFEEQKVVVGSQETEMLTKKRELDQLRSEESQLQNQLGTFRHDVDSLSQNLGQTQLQISQVKTRLLHLEEYERRLTEGLSDLDAAINNNDYHKLNSLLVRPVTPPPELVIIFILMSLLLYITTFFSFRLRLLRPDSLKPTQMRKTSLA